MRLRPQGICGTLLTFSILLNAITPQRMLCADELSTLSIAFHSQSTIINFCIAASLPCRIINYYLIDHGFGVPAQRHENHQRPSRNDARTDNAAITEQSFQHRNTGKNTPGSADFVPGTSPESPVPGRPVDTGDVLPVVLWGCVMLLFFFLLPRSSISEDAVIHAGAH